MSAPRSPSGEPWARAPSARLIGLVLILAAVRLAVAASLPLTEDEAYYRLWAQAPALGYFDHPPMIAWWIWLGERLAGDTPLAIRLLPCVACAVTSYFVYDLALGLGADAQSGGRALIWYNATLLVVAGGFLAVPDAPAAFFWTLSLWAIMRAGSPAALRWWIVAGLAAGAASLSKYSSLFLAPGVFIWLASSVEGRRRLATAGPWVALGMAAALFGLNVAWNATHGWLTFAKQFGRVAPHGFAPRHLMELIVGQALLLNPLITVFIVRAVVGRGRLRAVRPGLIWATSAPFGLYLVLHSLHATVQAHWPAPLYPGLAVVAALAAADLPSAGFLERLRAATPFIGFGLAVAAGLYLALPLAGAALRFDPATPLRGWPPFVASLERERTLEDAAWIGTTSYGLAAQLLDVRGIGAPVLQVSERDRWRGLRPAAADLSQPGLIVDLSRRVSVQSLRGCFAAIRPLGEMTRAAPREPGKTYSLFLVSGPKRDVLAEGC